jgi:hypothetical protein
MMEEQRQEPRQPLSCVAHITSVEGTAHWDCTVVDISSDGIRLKFDCAEAIPEEFRLSLTKSRRLWRNCKVVWRRDSEIGARYAEHSGA